jgi:hypothetical protein
MPLKEPFEIDWFKVRALLALIFFIQVFIMAPWRVMTLGAEVLFMSPGHVRSDNGTHRYWDALSLESKLEMLNYSVTYAGGLEVDGHEAYGVTDMEKHAIIIDGGLSWNARLAVLAHEAGHTLQPGWVTTRQAEAFAETVAMLVSHDGYREHARYLASHKMDALFMMVVEWPSMYHAAALLEDR